MSSKPSLHLPQVAFQSTLYSKSCASSESPLESKGTPMVWLRTIGLVRSRPQPDRVDVTDRLNTHPARLLHVYSLSMEHARYCSSAYLHVLAMARLSEDPGQRMSKTNEGAPPSWGGRQRQGKAKANVGRDWFMGAMRSGSSWKRLAGVDLHTRRSCCLSIPCLCV
jgi:hypothetical protein